MIDKNKKGETHRGFTGSIKKASIRSYSSTTRKVAAAEALDNDYTGAFHALCEIQKLYEIERIGKRLV